MQMGGNLKSLPFDQRRKMAQEKIGLICSELGVDIIPILAQNPGAIIAQLLYVDVEDPEALKRLGLVKPKVNESGEKITN